QGREGKTGQFLCGWLRNNSGKGSGHRPIRIRSRSSTAASVDDATIPQRSCKRERDTERISSHLTKLGCRTPPSGGSIITWNGIPFAREVTGKTTTRSAGP